MPHPARLVAPSLPSLDLYWCKSAHAEQAVQALRQLPQLTVSLGIHAYWGTEATAVPGAHYYAESYDPVAVPAMAGLHLTALRLLGRVTPPPDLLKLEQLSSLELRCLKNWVDWDEEPWTSLVSLSRLGILRTTPPGAWGGLQCGLICSVDIGSN